MPLSQGQLAMLQDGCPLACLSDTDTRRAAWVGFVPKASANTGGTRRDPRASQRVPVNPQERRMLRLDDTPTSGNQATPDSGQTPQVATNEDTMTKTSKTTKTAKTAKKSKAKKSKAKKSAVKKPVAARGKSATKTTGPGVIDTIVECIAKPNGASADEILAVLTKRFPDREPDSMRKTILIQANKNAKKKDTDDKRGKVYYGNGKRL